MQGLQIITVVLMMSCKANPPLLVFFFCNFCLQLIFPSRGSFQAELIFVTNITNYICGEKIVMWKNLGKFWEFWRHFGKFWEILRNFGKFWEICHNLRPFMWRKIERKKYICGEKMTNMRSVSRLPHRPDFTRTHPPGSHARLSSDVSPNFFLAPSTTINPPYAFLPPS